MLVVTLSSADYESPHCRRIEMKLLADGRMFCARLEHNDKSSEFATVG